MRWMQRTHKHFSGLLLAFVVGWILLLLLGAWHFIRRSIPFILCRRSAFLSFAAIAQFAPALIGGLYWRAPGNRKGVYVGLLVGSVIADHR